MFLEARASDTATNVPLFDLSRTFALVPSLPEHRINRLTEPFDDKIRSDAAHGLEHVAQARTYLETIVLDPVERALHKLRHRHRFDADIALFHIALKERRFRNGWRKLKHGDVGMLEL